MRYNMIYFCPAASITFSVTYKSANFTAIAVVGIYLWFPIRSPVIPEDVRAYLLSLFDGES